MLNNVINILLVEHRKHTTHTIRKNHGPEGHAEHHRASLEFFIFGSSVPFKCTLNNTLKSLPARSYSMSYWIHMKCEPQKTLTIPFNTLLVWVVKHPYGIFPLLFSCLCCFYVMSVELLLITFFDPHCPSIHFALSVFFSPSQSIFTYLSKCATVSSFALRDWSSYQGE